MPVTRSNIIESQPDTAHQVALEPVFNVFCSLALFSWAEKMSGLSGWVYQAVAGLSRQTLWNHRLVFEGLHYAVLPEYSLPSFPDYIRQLAAVDPLHLRDRLFDAYRRVHLSDAGQWHCFAEEPDPMDLEAVLSSPEAYIAFLESHFGCGSADVELEREAYMLVVDPPAMQRFIVAHLWKMWDEVMAPEWERVEPVLKSVVAAYQQVDLSGKSPQEAAAIILEADRLVGKECLGEKLESARSITFIPSAHVGSHQFDYGYGPVRRLVFGMRVPQGAAVDVPELKRNEVLVRINALADDTRLKILQLIGSAGPMTASEVMTHLELSQSAASRHLMQLSATGYLSESRVQGAKQYTLDARRIEETLKAISAFLLNK